MDFIDSLATEIVQIESGDHQVSKLHQILRSPGRFLAPEDFLGVSCGRRFLLEEG